MCHPPDSWGDVRSLRLGVDYQALLAIATKIGGCLVEVERLGEEEKFVWSERERKHQEAILGAVDSLGERIGVQLGELGRLLPMYEQLAEYAYGEPIVDQGSRGITVEEIEKCRNQRAGARYAAELNGGKIRVRDVARVIHASSLSKGSLASVRSALLRYVKEGDEWEALGGGWFRLLGADGPYRSESPGASSERAAVSRLVAEVKEVCGRAEAAVQARRARGEDERTQGQKWTAYGEESAAFE